MYKDVCSGKITNEEFAKWACKHNMKWNDSNFFISEDTSKAIANVIESFNNKEYTEI